MSAIVLFDGVCNFCNGAVNFIIDHDCAGYFKFAALQSEAGKKLLADSGIDANSIDSIVLIEKDRTYIHSGAALKIAENLDGVWKIFSIFRVVPAFLRDICYKIFAKFRYRLFGRTESCRIPTKEIRSRFLE